MFKLADDTRSEWPVYYITTSGVVRGSSLRGRVRVVLLHARQFGTDLRKSTDPKVDAKMVFCNRNDDLLRESIQEKINNRYVAKFARSL